MDLYSTILSQGGKILQDGSAWRGIISKDGTKVIQQFASKVGNSAVDVYEASSNKLISSSRKFVKPDGSWLSKVLNYAKGTTQIFVVQQLGEKEKGSFMSALFKFKVPQTAPTEGEFLHVVDKIVQKKGKVTYIPVNKSIMPQDGKLFSRVNTFNTKFGKIE